MSSDKQLRDVQDYLQRCKQLVNAGKWHLEPRNFPTITALGLTLDDVSGYLLTLKPHDYCKTEADHDSRRPGDIWFFLFDEPGSVLDYYVKLKLHPQLIHLSVISFHPPEAHIRRRFKP